MIEKRCFYSIKRLREAQKVKQEKDFVCVI